MWILTRICKIGAKRHLANINERNARFLKRLLKESVMKRILTYIFAVLTFAIAGTTRSEIVINSELTVDRVGVANGLVFFAVKEGLSRSCLFDLIYANLDTSLGKHAHVTLLMAKLTGKKLSRIEYGIGVVAEFPTQCVLLVIEVDD